MDFSVSISTYARHDLIGRATLSALEKAKVHPDQINIFVPNDEQLRDYREVLGNKYRLIVSEPGLFKSKQFQHRWFVEQGRQGERIIQMDDDIWGFSELVERPGTKAGWANIPYEGTLEDIARQGYGLAESLGTGLWGMSFSDNYFYMSDHASIGNMLVCGAFQGCYAGDDIFIGPNRTYIESAEEDGETSCLAFIKYGKVIRLQYLSLVVKHIEQGGIRSEVMDNGYVQTQAESVAAREMTNVAAREMIAQRYPGLVTVVWKDKKDSFLGNGRQQALRYTRMGNTNIPRSIIESEFLK